LEAGVVRDAKEVRMMTRKLRVPACALSVLAVHLHAAEAQKTVVLTFDDACKSHATVVAPLLKEHGFNATFFVSEGFINPRRKDRYMTWEEIKKLHDQGFEIGNRTKGHHDMRNLSEEQVVNEIEHIEAKCKKAGVPKPTTFAYPGYHTSETVLKALKERGYKFARTGGGKASRPGKEDPLLLPDVLCPTPKTTFDDLKKAADQADGELIPIFTFHGVPDADHPWVNTKPALFTKFVQYLKDNNFKVIALRDYPVTTPATSKKLTKKEDPT
jgi:peptidoglycan/xylan/chitin deacetylase (PgdA/CDA1 family)